MNVLILNDNSAHCNWGAQATPPALRAVVQHGVSDCTMQWLSHRWLATSSYRRLKTFFGGGTVRASRRRVLRSIVHRCSKPISFYPEVADDFEGFADLWQAREAGPVAREFIERADIADVIVYNGENSIYRNTPEGCHGIFLLWLTKTRLKKPCCIVNHTCHQNDVRPIMTGMIRKTYPLLDLVAIREPASQANLHALGIRNAELFPDVVFGLEVDCLLNSGVAVWRHKHNLSEQGYFCLSASGLPMSMPRKNDEGEVVRLVRELKEALGMQAVLVAKDPWCLPLAEVAQRTDSLYFGPDHAYQDLWPLFEGAACLVTGHYHYAIFSAMVGCPFVPLSVNNHKMRGLCEHLEWQRTEPSDATWLASCRGEIIEEAQRVQKDREKLSAKLLEKSTDFRKRALSLGKRIAETVKRLAVGSISQLASQEQSTRTRAEGALINHEYSTNR